MHGAQIMGSYGGGSYAIVVDADSTAPLEEPLAPAGNVGRSARMLGSSPAMQSMYQQIARVTATCATVFISGESGTGKELVARTIHESSRRRRRQFVAVNCGAIPAQLGESALFGHERGSFTGAVRDHRGYFERAHGGTLFLDEITEMPLELQVKLLRVLESRSFSRVGADHEIEIDVRIIAATNRDPLEAVASGRLREDLLYRLQVFPLHVPALRERGQDIAVLAEHFLSLFARQEDIAKPLSVSAASAMRSYHWPGNVRELKNRLHRAYIMADDIIEAEHVFPHPPSGSLTSSSLLVQIGTSLAAAERELILATVAQCGAKGQAARLLGISDKTLYNKLQRYQPHLPSTNLTSTISKTA